MLTLERSKVLFLNAILPRLNGNITFCDYDFTASPQSCVALTLNAASSLFAVQVYNFDFLKNYPELNAKTPDNIPAPLLCAAFEKSFLPYLQKTGSAIDTQITVLDYIDEEGLQAFRHHIDVNYKDAENDLIFNLRLFAKDDNAFSAMLQRITSLPKINVPLEDPVLNCDFVIGSLKLTLAEIKSLKTGDAVIFDSEFIKSGKLNFVCEGLQAPAQYNAEKHQITLLSSLQKTDSGDDMADSEELTTIEDVELTINFSLESIKLPLSSIKELTEGSVLDLNNSALENIAVKLEGKTIGYGRIIEVGGKNALQITRI